jgi:hypothetical protein
MPIGSIGVRPDSGAPIGRRPGSNPQLDRFRTKDRIDEANNRENRGDNNQTSLTELLAGLYGGGGGGGGGGGRAKSPTIDLDPFKNKELDAMRKLLQVTTDATRTELTGERSRASNAFERFQALRNKQLTDQLRAGRGDSSRRGILDSGIFIKGQAELRNVASDEISSEDVRTTALVNALSRQIGGKNNFLGRGEQDFGVGTLAAGQSAQEASRTAEIERAYLNARISQGG